MVHNSWIFGTHALYQYPQEAVSVEGSGRVGNWTGHWDTSHAKTIDSSKKNIALYNATVGNKEDIAGR